ncbi:MAG: tRNA (guanosine(46)-N7)-methyltransferase TrmB, partial [Tenericutes bacterium HGW-Tenericutes-6]
MRQKKIKYATRELMEAYDVITLPKMLDLNDDRPVFIEIGSGKGQFITSLARDNKAHLYIALEMNINVCYRILEKKNELKLDNLIIILGDAKDLDL